MATGGETLGAEIGDRPCDEPARFHEMAKKHGLEELTCV